MKKLNAFILLISILILIHPQSTAESPPSLDIFSAVNGSQWDYQYNIQGFTTPAGVSIQLPTGFSYISSNLPVTQVHLSADSVHFAIPDGNNFSFTLTGSSGILTGINTNYLTGEENALPPISMNKGTTSIVQDSTYTQDLFSDTEESHPSAGFSTISILISLISGVVILAWRRS